MGEDPEKDFGLESRETGLGEGDAEARFEGVMRHFGPFCQGVAMLAQRQR